MVKLSRSNVLHATGSGSSPGLLAGHIAATYLRHSRAPTATASRYAITSIFSNSCPFVKFVSRPDLSPLPHRARFFHCGTDRVS